MDDRLKTLFEYTKFHIGIYITIGTAIVGALAFEAANPDFSLGDPARIGLQVSILFQGLAGLGGGIIAGNLVSFTSFETFHETPIYWGKIPQFWERVEHWSFWASIIIAAVSGAFLVDQISSSCP